MKIRNIFKFGLVWLVLGLGLSIVQPVRGQTTNPGALFQYAIFYNGLLEFSDCATLTINGPVHCNSNIFLGTPSVSTLTFNGLVTASGIITNPPNFGYSQSSWTGTTTFKGTPTPGYVTGEPIVNLPIATNNYHKMIELPNAGDSPTNTFNYYYMADLVILVTNTTPTNVAVIVTFQTSYADPAPMTVSYTNYTYAASTNFATSNAIYQMNTNWAWWFGSTNSLTNWQTSWLTTNASFFDARQGQTNHVTQIDVGKFGTWIATNTNCLAKWNDNFSFNGIIYVADMRTTNGMYMDCVRLTNGQTIPSIGASNILVGGSYHNTNDAYTIPGLTVATINPLYIAGLYNCPSSNNIGTTNVIGTQPCSVICDALTILSPSWRDGNSWTEATTFTIPTASSNTVNTAIIAGNVPSTGTGATQYSGGLQNLPRLLENWSASTLWLNTSIINLYPSAQATVQFQNPGIYYTAPTRQFYFDQNFNNFSMLPPGTPLFGFPFIPATIVLTNLTQVYTGGYLYPTVYSNPTGPKIILSFPTVPSGEPPIYPGNYPVTATIEDPYVFGTASNTFIISQATAGVTITDLSQTYNGSGTGVSVTTVPAGLDVNLTYNGSAILPTNAGTYTIVATVNDTNYQGSATNTLVINRAVAAVTLSNLSQVFSGAAEGASVTTIPPGLMVNVTYNGSTNAPTNTGSYTVVATVNDTNYQGSATNTLVIAPPVPTPITLGGSTILASGTFQLSFTNTPGASFSVLGSADPTVPVADWTVLGNATEVSPGQFQFIDTDATNQSLQFYTISSP